MPARAVTLLATPASGIPAVRHQTIVRSITSAPSCDAYHSSCWIVVFAVVPSDVHAHGNPRSPSGVPSAAGL